MYSTQFSMTANPKETRHSPKMYNMIDAQNDCWG